MQKSGVFCPWQNLNNSGIMILAIHEKFHAKKAILWMKNQ